MFLTAYDGSFSWFWLKVLLIISGTRSIVAILQSFLVGAPAEVLRLLDGFRTQDEVSAKEPQNSGKAAGRDSTLNL